MAKKTLLVDLNLNQNELLFAVVQQLSTAPTSPSPKKGQMYGNTTDNILYYYNGTTWVNALSQGTPTALSTGTVTGISFGITSDGSTDDVVLPQSVAGGNAGLMSGGDKTKIDGIESGADKTDATNVDAAGAVMNSDSNVSAMGFVIDEDSFSSDTATKVPTQQSVKAYVAGQINAVNSTITGALIYKGAATPSTPPSVGVKQGWTYVFSAAGTFLGAAVSVGDMIIANQTTPTTLAHWTVINKNIPDIVTASESEVGIVELATAAETTTGTDNARAVHPAGLKVELDKKSNLNSPTFTGAPNLPNGAVAATQSPGNSSTAIATTAFVSNEITNDAVVKSSFVAASDFVVGTGVGAYAKKTLAETKLILGIATGTNRYSTTIGNGTLTSIAVTHSLGNQFVTAQVFDSTTFEQIECEVVSSSTSVTTFNFNVAPTSAQYTVVIIG